MRRCITVVLLLLGVAFPVRQGFAEPKGTAQQKPAPKAQEKGGNAKADTVEKKGAVKDFFSPSDASKDAPLFVKSANLHLDAKARTFTYEGDVEVTKGDVVITADKVIGVYDEQNHIESIECVKNVVITRADGLRATSNRAFYSVKKATIELTESPDLFNQGNALSADKFTVFVNEDRFEASGNVRAKVIQADDVSPMGQKKK